MQDYTLTQNPLTVPKSVLHTLSRHDPMRATGQTADENNAILAMYLPDMCGELVAGRAELATLRLEVETLRRAQRSFGQKFAAFFGFPLLAAKRQLAGGL